MSAPQPPREAAEDYALTRDRQTAARAWCHPTTSHLVMDPALAEVFAHLLAAERAGLYAALSRAVPLLVRLGDFIGNGEVTGPGSLGERCDVLLAARTALAAAEGRTP